MSLSKLLIIKLLFKMRLRQLIIIDIWKLSRNMKTSDKFWQSKNGSKFLNWVFKKRTKSCVFKSNLEGKRLTWKIQLIAQLRDEKPGKYCSTYERIYLTSIHRTFAKYRALWINKQNGFPWHSVKRY